MCVFVAFYYRGPAFSYTDLHNAHVDDALNNKITYKLCDNNNSGHTSCFAFQWRRQSEAARHKKQTKQTNKNSVEISSAYKAQKHTKQQTTLRLWLSLSSQQTPHNFVCVNRSARFTAAFRCWCVGHTNLIVNTCFMPRRCVHVRCGKRRFHATSIWSYFKFRPFCPVFC